MCCARLLQRFAALFLEMMFLRPVTLQEGACLVVGCLCFCLVGHFTDTTYGITRCFCPVAVLQLAAFRLANSFLMTIYDLPFLKFLLSVMKIVAHSRVELLFRE